MIINHTKTNAPKRGNIMQYCEEKYFVSNINDKSYSTKELRLNKKK